MCISTNTLTLSAAVRFIRSGGSELPASCIALTHEEEARTVRIWQALCGLFDPNGALS